MRGTSSAPISASTSSVTCSWRSKPGSLASITWSSSAASRASSRVDLNEATRPWGRFLMKPTVSLTSTRGTLGVEHAHRGIQRGEELVGHQHLAAGEGAHQRGLAGVGVAHQRHRGEALAALAASALGLALELHRGDLELQLGDAVADLAPVELGVDSPAPRPPTPLRWRPWGPASLAISRRRGAM
jgi:hypothetical protein